MSNFTQSRTLLPVEGEHPLSEDPLHSLPDAVSVPRHPIPRAPYPSSPHAPVNRRKPALPPPPLTPPTPPALEAFDLLRAHPHVDDPLLRNLAERVSLPQSQQPNEPYATDIHAALAALEESEREPPSDGVIDRSDVTLFPATTQRGTGAGVYLVRSRRNWAIVSTPTQEDYYIVRRSIADFVWLNDCLRARTEGVIVPCLPPMNIMGRISHGYAYDTERLKGLQAFLRRVATHAVLSTRDEILAFLGALGEKEWQKIRREFINHENSITSALFGSSADENAFHRISHWSEKFLWQTGRRVNKALTWFLEPDQSKIFMGDSAEARVDRLHAYVKELSFSLAAARCAAERVQKQREAERLSVITMQNSLRELGRREGGKFGTLLEQIVLQIPTQAQAGIAGYQQMMMTKDGDPGVNIHSNAPLVAHLSLNSTPSPAIGRGTQNRSPEYWDMESNISAAPSQIIPLTSSIQREIKFRMNAEEDSQKEDSRSPDVIVLPVMRVIRDVFRNYEEQAKDAQRIMSTRKEEQDAYEHAFAVHTKLRDKLETKTESMWQERGASSGSGGELESLKVDADNASKRLKEIRERYKQVAVSTAEELRRLRNDMHQDLSDLLYGMATEYARQHAAHASAWRSLADGVYEFRNPGKKMGSSSPHPGSVSYRE